MLNLFFKHTAEYATELRKLCGLRGHVVCTWRRRRTDLTLPRFEVWGK